MDKLKIIFTTLGSAGDVLPMVGLGAAMRSRRHDVTLVANGHFKEAAERSGIEFVEVGNIEKFDLLTKEKEVWNPRKGMELLFKEVYLPRISEVYEIIKARADNRTVVVSSIFMFGARIAHEKLGVPLVTLQLQPSAFWSPQRPAEFAAFSFIPKLPYFLRRMLLGLVDRLIDRVAAPDINAFNKKIGLAPIKNVISRWAISPQLVVGLFPEWFAPPAPDWPQQTRLVGFAGFDKFFSEDNIKLSSDSERFFAAGDKPIIFTPGTAMRHAKRFFETASRAVQKINRRAIFLTLHKENVPDKLPDNIAHFDYLPLSLALTKAAMLVHHGGIGTVAQALGAGIPQIIIPFNFDQPDNARRIATLGAGAGLKDPGVDALADRMEAILNDRKMIGRCVELSKRISFAGAVAATCDAIEALRKC